MDQDRPRILLVMQLPPPLHGAAYHNRLVTGSSLLNRRFRVDLIPLRFSRKLQDLGHPGLVKLLKALRITFFLITKMLAHRYRMVVFTFSTDGYALWRDILWGLLIRSYRCPVVFYLRGYGYRKKHSRMIQYGLKKVFNRVYTIQHADLLYRDIAHLVPRDRAFFLANGIPIRVDDRQFEALARDRKSRSGDVRILFLSHMRVQKGFDILLKACGRLKRRKIENFRVWFAGGWCSSEDRSLFERLTSEQELESRAAYLGFAGTEKKHDLLRTADILVFPSRQEAFGNVNLEAMQYGLPVVASQEGAIPTIIEDGESGFLFPKGDDRRLTDYLMKLIEDPLLRMTMGCRGRDRFIKHYTFECYQQNLCRILQGIIRTG